MHIYAGVVVRVATPTPQAADYATGKWMFTSVERTLNSSATELTIYLGDSTNATGTQAVEFYIDTITIQVEE